jgi:class 3 adenylate cyclase/Tfp pilus assembly protein PilF
MVALDAERKLVAVLCADIVGYSRMIGEDEEGTLAALAAHTSELIAPAVASHHGRIVKTMGDGFLAEFASPVAAARCAFEIQDGLRRRNDQVAEHKRQQLRIGLNLGDVSIRDGDIFGDAVNVAARLQALAEPGGVYSSAAVVDQLRGHAGFAWDDLGEKSLKNIARPIKVFRLLPADPATAPPPPPLKRRRSGMPRILYIAGAAALVAIVVAAAYAWLWAPSPAGTPSLAVLPFVNQSGDPADDYFSQGITGDITDALGRFSSLRVMAHRAVLPYKDKGASAEIGRALGVRYLVEGSVRRSADRVRVSARLTDAQHGSLLWSEQFERPLKDIFDVQDAVTLRVAGMLAANLTRIEQQRALSKRPEHLDAYDLVLRGRAALLRATRSSNREARQHFTQALQRDANYAAAHAWLGLAYYDVATLGWTEFPEDVMARAEELAQKALSIDPDQLDAHRLLSKVNNARFKSDLALIQVDRALALNSSDAESHAARGDALLWLGRADEAIAALETAFALNPNLAHNDVFALGLAYYTAHRLEDSVRFLERQALRLPDFVFIRVVLAAAYGQLGRAGDAGRTADLVKRKLPVFDPQIFGSRFQNRAHHEYLIEGLRKAGLA